jgi:hypothetical protein
VQETLEGLKHPNLLYEPRLVRIEQLGVRTTRLFQTLLTLVVSMDRCAFSIDCAGSLTACLHYTLSGWLLSTIMVHVAGVQSSTKQAESTTTLGFLLSLDYAFTLAVTGAKDTGFRGAMKVSKTILIHGK